MNIDLSEQQKQVMRTIWDWYGSSGDQGQTLTLGGYAGTGKTTLIGFLSALLRKKDKKARIAFCSYTGKAARILKLKLADANAVIKGDSVSTIHRLIYTPVVDDREEIIGWEKREAGNFPYKLIVVDEASMINQDIWKDLLSYGVPILAVGDHGQLPPIEGSFNLMTDPQLRLEEIYRQQKGNPIIQVSEMIRRSGELPVGTYGKYVKKYSRQDPDVNDFMNDIFTSYNDETMILVGYNHTRVKINQAVRQQQEIFSEQPVNGDRVICLRNNYKKQIFNGMTGVIKRIEEIDVNEKELYNAEIDFGDDEYFRGNISRDQFGSKTTLRREDSKDVDLFDFSYALTVHKAQGSQAGRVVVFEERFQQMDDEMWRRWLYTAVTRAVNELYLVGN